MRACRGWLTTRTKCCVDVALASCARVGSALCQHLTADCVVVLTPSIGEHESKGVEGTPDRPIVPAGNARNVPVGERPVGTARSGGVAGEPAVEAEHAEAAAAKALDVYPLREMNTKSASACRIRCAFVGACAFTPVALVRAQPATRWPRAAHANPG